MVFLLCQFSCHPETPSLRNLTSQRAFRQRKEGYIKKLEEQVRELHNLEDNFKAIQAENYSLREYIIHLQSHLIESQGDYPQPPANVNLSHPHARHEHIDHLQRRDGAPVAPMAPMSQLQASAARTLPAAGLQSAQHGQDEHSYDHAKKYKETADDTAQCVSRFSLLYKPSSHYCSSCRVWQKAIPLELLRQARLVSDLRGIDALSDSIRSRG